MKRTLAALTAIALTAGLSLAAVVAPASADDSTTPTPVASSTPTSTPTPASTPTSTETASPTSTPTATPSVAPAPSPAPSTETTSTAPALAVSKFTATTQTFLPAAPVYETVVWAMAPGNGHAVAITDGSATYPQVGVAQYKNENTKNLSVTVPDTCGTSYQVDVYVQKSGSTDNTAALDALFASGLKGPNGAQDGKYLAEGGLGTAWKFVTNTACVPKICIPDSAVSYHYNANDNNDGYVLVNNVPNSTNALCHPFWVTATSWKFTTGSSVWPQTRDVVDKVGKISAPGTYNFAAKVTCGQGDIYASFDANAPSLNPGLNLYGSSNPFAEHFLSDMGFTGSKSPTYTQDKPSCFVPIPETGTPTSTVLSCAPYSSNSLTLPAVPGGVWTVTSAHYSHTYAIGTGVTGYTPTFFEQYTIVLADGSSTDGYLVTGNTAHWTPVNPQLLDCNTLVTPVKPDVQTIEKCGVDGSITIPGTTGVVYSLDGNIVPAGTISGLSGQHVVTAVPAPGYEFSPSSGAKVEWDFDLNSEKTCDVTTVVGDCTADGSVSSVPVSVTLDNTSSSVSSSFEVKIVGGSFDQTFVVPAHTKTTEPIGSSPTSGETVDVFINGSSTAVVLTIDKFQGCVPVTPSDPTFTTLSCTGTTTNLGTISTDGNPNLTYTLNGPGNTNVSFPSLPGTPTISGLAAGSYVVSVTANPGFVLSGASSFPVTINLPAVDCVGTEQTPVVASVAPVCTPNPENQADGFNAALTEIQGTITIPSNPNMTFTIFDGTTTTPISAGTYVEPDGTYTVVATLTATAIADGFTFGPSAGYTRSAGNTVATFANIVFTSECGLPTLASWHSGATATPASCTLTGNESGTITVVHGSDITHPTDENGKVTYTLVNNGNGHTTNLGSTALTVSVAPGTYTVKAVPTDPADGLVGNPNATNEIDYTVTVAAAVGSCDSSLAFTGGTIAWAGFVLAGGMLFLGIAFLLIRRRNRTAE